MSTKSSIKGTEQFMAPELHGFRSGQSSHSSAVDLNPYVADMWSLGEITFQMLTKSRTFENTWKLLQYAQDHESAPFPLERLTAFNVTSEGQNFITSMMVAVPDRRLTADQACAHA